jgi:hypothetical protein
MQLRQIKTFDTGRRVQGFLGSQAAAIGTAVPPGLRAKLDNATDQLVSYQLEQDNAAGSARGETANQEALQRDINERLLRPIARVARFALRDKPDFDVLVVPSDSMPKRVFVSKLTGLADAAAKYEQTFVENFIPSDFIAQLRVAAAQIEGSGEARARHLSRRNAATAGLVAADKMIRDVVGVLDGALTPMLKSNPAALADWIASKRFQQTVVNPIATGDIAPAEGSTDGPPDSEQPAPESENKAA